MQVSKGYESVALKFDGYNCISTVDFRMVGELANAHSQMANAVTSLNDITSERRSNLGSGKEPPNSKSAICASRSLCLVMFQTRNGELNATL